MKANRKFWENKNGALNMIIMGLLILVISALSIAIFYPVLRSVDTSTIDSSLASKLGENTTTYTPGANATGAIASTGNTVMGLNPLAALVAVAAGIVTLLLGAFLVGGGGMPKL